MLKNIFGDYIWITSLDSDFVKEYEKEFNEDKKTNIDTGSWSKCDVVSSFFNNDLVKNCKKIDYNGNFSIKILNELDNFMNELSKSQKSKLNNKFKINTIWYNIYRKGDFQEVHDHAFINGVYSYVYLLRSKDKGKDSRLMFDNPRGALFKYNNYTKILDGVDNYMGDYVPELYEGDLIIFPTHMKHYVSVHKNENDVRITISGNITLL